MEWNLDYFFKSEIEFTEEIEKVKKLLEDLLKMNKNISSSLELEKILTLRWHIKELSNNILIYGSLSYYKNVHSEECIKLKKQAEEFNNEVTNILNRIVLNTQSNAVPLKMSPNRAGATNDFRRLLSIFSSDLQNKINYIIKYTEGYKNTVKRIKYIENSSLPQGTQRVKTQGKEGCSVVAHKTVMYSGQVIETSDIKSNYKPITKIVEVGTA